MDHGQLVVARGHTGPHWWMTSSPLNRASRTEFGTQLSGGLEALVRAELFRKKRLLAPGMWPACLSRARPRPEALAARGHRSGGRSRAGRPARRHRSIPPRVRRLASCLASAGAAARSSRGRARRHRARRPQHSPASAATAKPGPVHAAAAVARPATCWPARKPVIEPGQLGPSRLGKG